MSATTYSNAPQERLLKLVFVLAGHEQHGLAPIEIAKALGAPRSTVLRDLNVMRNERCAEQIPETDRWRLGPRIVQVAIAFSNGISRARSKLDETEQRYTRQP